MTTNLPLTTKFDNVPDALPADVVAPTADRTGSQRFHLGALDADAPEPFCQTGGDSWRFLDTTQARQLGYTPCHNCFGPILQYCARDADHPVEHVPPGERSPVTDGGAQQQYRPELDTIPETVVTAGRSRTFHAPSLEGDSEPRCPMQDSTNYREVAYEAIEGHYEPCGFCFSEKAESITE